MRFHVSRAARDRYQLDAALFGADGSVAFADFHTARQLAAHINQTRNLVSFPERAVRAGQINAMGAIGEVLRLVTRQYDEQCGEEVRRRAIEHLDSELGREQVDLALLQLVDEFPPTAVHPQGMIAATYLSGQTDGVPNRQLLVGELLQLWLANVNPAKSPFLELFDDANLERETPYLEIIAGLEEFFRAQPTFGPGQQPLIEMLRSPAVAAPHSLPGQLEFIRKRWGTLLGKHYYNLLSSLDLIREEEKAGFPGAGPARVYEFSGLEIEPEQFSPDRAWMPRLVLLAKNTHVWLDQLSRRHRRSITRLDQVPETELEQLARWGITGLWLIGVWERSPASRRIKELSGNPAAAASAYSLFDYQIAAALGGDAAYADLRDRAMQHGIRLASDMVPNHTGIDSRWVTDHPDWFLSVPQSPFPSYSFNGPDLSADPRVGLYLEDRYYDRQDAAVVFKRVDRQTGDKRYVYHGNDGTNMPWNDTAQLDYMNPDVRAAVIDTIVAVARQFPIIRFDAAMTLANKHYHRLWFPEPGAGGAIPSRAEHGMSKAEFATRMPVEFWREVVNRVAAEAPDTLLLAEAFWLMEGYFVRTLGMHRVYNSAFMTMLRDEQNEMYRRVMKNTLEFEPEILKRYVNFMSNPDERTTIDQFGTGDKYFGICTMMATLPGLPMFGHGQIEGYAEKYGMEYTRASWDETPDQQLIEHHEQQIFTLLHRRHLFAGVEEFLLYDCETAEQTINDDVFAYSNRAGDERCLVLYHNRYADTRGWVRQSVPFAVKGAGGDQPALERRTLAAGLGLRNEEHWFCLFRDQVTGLEYIRQNTELSERGLAVHLGAYERHVFVDFRQVEDNAWHQYAQLCAYLDGRGVPSIEEASREILLRPIHQPYRELVNADLFRQLTGLCGKPPGQPAWQKIDARIAELGANLGQEVHAITGGGGLAATELATTLRLETRALLQLPRLDRTLTSSRSTELRAAVRYLEDGLTDEPAIWGTLLGWLFTHSLGDVAGGPAGAERSRAWIDEWLLGRILTSALADLGLDDEAVAWALARIKVLTTHQRWHRHAAGGGERTRRVLEPLLRDPAALHLLQVNRHQGILWFNKEAFAELVWWMFVAATVEITAGIVGTDSRAAARPARTGDKPTPAGTRRRSPSPVDDDDETPTTTGATGTDAAATELRACFELTRELLTLAEQAGYQVEKLFG